MPIPRDAIVITGLGMASSLGPNVVTSCAASRAGLTRATELDYLVEDTESFEMIPVIGHSLSFTEGFSELGRLVQLGGQALRDLLRHNTLHAADIEQSAILVNLRSGYYLQQVDQLYAENAQQTGAVEERISPAYADLMSWYESKLVVRLLGAVGISVSPHLHQCFFKDQAGVALTLLRAQDLLTSGHASFCIVGGVDSLLDFRWLRTCDDLGLLRTPLHPVGFMPGEAAAFLLLETYAHARRRNAPVMAVVGEPALKQDTLHRFSETPPDGVALAEVILAVLEENAVACDSCFISLNGDPAQSYEWGNAWVRLRPHVDMEEVFVPSASFGEIGAAFAYVAACLAVRAFVRNYHASEALLICASSDTGLKGSFVLNRGTYLERRNAYG